VKTQSSAPGENEGTLRGKERNGLLFKPAGNTKGKLIQKENCSSYDTHRKRGAAFLQFREKKNEKRPPLTRTDTKKGFSVKGF